MNKFKKWLYERYLPAYCREKLTEENESLKKQLQEATAENRELKAYINGMQTRLKSVKIQINNRGD
jgi:FtsZ-binding cell division protein ZapB